MLEHCDVDELTRFVPATPDWCVHDALAHVVGITVDLNALNFGREDPGAWTAAQVNRGRHLSVAELAAEWVRKSPQFEEGLRLLGYSIGSHYVGDLHAHIQDVHQALGRPADRDELTVLVSLDFYLESFGDALAAASAGAVEVRAGSERHVVGAGDVVATLAGDPFEILRTLSGRRSMRQIRALDWGGAVDAILPLVSRYPIPEADLDE